MKNQSCFENSRVNEFLVILKCALVILIGIQFWILACFLSICTTRYLFLEIGKFFSM